MSDWGTSRGRPFKDCEARAEPAPSPAFADFSAATASSRVAPCAPSEMNAAKAATAAMADLVMVMLLPELC
jgi:hypothetical protein